MNDAPRQQDPQDETERGLAEILAIVDGRLPHTSRTPWTEADHQAVVAEMQRHGDVMNFLLGLLDGAYALIVFTNDRMITGAMQRLYGPSGDKLRLHTQLMALIAFGQISDAMARIHNEPALVTHIRSIMRAQREAGFDALRRGKRFPQQFPHHVSFAPGGVPDRFSRFDDWRRAANAGRNGDPMPGTGIHPSDTIQPEGQSDT